MQHFYSMRHVIDYRPPWERKRRRPWAPGQAPPPDPDHSSVFPGGQVHHLTSFPDVYRPLGPRPVLPPAQPCTGPSECVPATPRALFQSDAPQTPNPKENQMITESPSPAKQEETAHELPHLEDLDPHTQRVICAAMAHAPERGLGPSALFAAPPIEAPAPESKEPRRRKPAKRHPSKPINIACHQAHCTICNHPERDAIEQAFLHWWRPGDLAYHFKLGNRLAVYRHAHATGLFQRRLDRTQHALGYIIEQAESVKPTADSIIRAVRALGCLDQNGRWHEPRKEVLITHQYLETPALLLDTPVEKKPNLIAGESTT